jgi:hypothetical protein
MRSTIVLSLCVVMLCAGLLGCSSDPPSVRVQNERTQKVNVQFKIGNYNTTNINDVEGGTVSAYRDVNEGVCVATATIQSENEAPTASINMSNDNNYTIVIVNSTPPTMRIDESGK